MPATSEVESRKTRSAENDKPFANLGKLKRSSRHVVARDCLGEAPTRPDVSVMATMAAAGVPGDLECRGGESRRGSTVRASLRAVNLARMESSAFAYQNRGDVPLGNRLALAQDEVVRCGTVRVVRPAAAPPAAKNSPKACTIFR